MDLSRRHMLISGAIGVAGSSLFLGASGAAAQTAGPGTSKVLDFPLVSRTAWGADESLMTWKPQDFHTAQVITLHHSGSELSPQDYDGSQKVREIYQEHSAKWGDIGYNLMIGPDGTVFEGRSTGNPQQPVFQGPVPSGQVPAVVEGAHAYHYNPGNIGICILGNYMTKAPTNAAGNTLYNLLAELCSLLKMNPLAGTEGVPPVNYQNADTGRVASVPGILGHQDWGGLCGHPNHNVTECPGAVVARQMQDIRQQTALRQALIG